MKLFIFDIDDTLTQTKRIDDACFVQTFAEMYQINLDEIRWEDFPHVTDRGLTESIFEQHLGRQATKDDVKATEDHFVALLQKAVADQPAEFLPTPGVIDFLDHLRGKEQPIAMATGAWRRSAHCKLTQAGIAFDPFTLATSNDSYRRRSIINIAIARAKFEYQIQFDSFVYFGDGLWDKITCEAMEIPLIGVDHRQNGKLSAAGHQHVIHDFKDVDAIMQMVMA